MEKEEEIERERGKKTILKSEQGSTLPVQLGQLMDKMEKGCCEANCGAQTTYQGYGIDKTRRITVCHLLLLH